jgi:hypothetical protein
LLDVDQSVGLNREVSDVETFLLQHSARFQDTLVFLSPMMKNIRYIADRWGGMNEKLTI